MKIYPIMTFDWSYFRSAIDGYWAESSVKAISYFAIWYDNCSTLTATILFGGVFMTSIRWTILVSLIILLLSSISCGGSDPVGGKISPVTGSTPMQRISSDGVLFDGTLYSGKDAKVSVAPDSAHLVMIQPPSGSPGVFRATCSSGAWRDAAGKDQGTSYTSDQRSFEWHAPSTSCAVQLLFVPVDISSIQLGMVVNVSNDWARDEAPSRTYDRSLAFVDPSSGQTVQAAAGELLVKLAPSVSLTAMTSLRPENDYQIMERVSNNDPVFRVKLDQGVDLLSAMQSLRKDPRVSVVEPNYIAFPALVPTDPKYGEKFEFPLIDAPQAWDIETGSPDVWVATVDTGADRDHPDLAGNIVPGKDFITGGDGLGGETPGDGIDNNGDGIIDGNVGHGTHVAGIIAAEAFNGVGACGIAFHTSILPLRVFPADGDSGASFSAIIEAVDYAATQPKVKVISMSLGTTYDSSLLQDAINTAWNAGEVIVAAAANSDTNKKYYPAAHDNVVAVAALAKNGVKAGFSNYGDWVDISAYGCGIYSTFFPDTYAYMSGTSMACPLVSGCFALLFAYDPNLTNTQAVTFLTQYSDNVDTLNPNYKGQLGSGIVNPYLALKALGNNEPGQVGDGNSDGKTSDTSLQLGPNTEG